MEQASATSLEELVKLEDPAFYLGDPFPVYRRLRREEPVFMYRPLGIRVVSTYADVRYGLRNVGLFSSARGLILTDVHRYVEDDRSTLDALLEVGGELISVTDPPRHGELRRVMSQGFVPGRMESLRPAVEDFCDRLLDGIAAGEPVDWVERMAVQLPILTVSALLGLPGDNMEDIRSWSDAIEIAANPQSAEEMEEAVAQFGPLDTYLLEQFGQRRGCPRDDMLSYLSEVEREQENITQANINSMAQALIAGGFGNTAAALAGFVALMAEHPEQLELIVGDRRLIPQAVEEVLRWVTPARGFLRTVTQATELYGQELRAGEQVYFLLDSANRDEEVFEAPDVFDVSRKRAQPTLAFGHGPHVCVAAPLARMELRTVVERLIDRFPRWRLAGEPRRKWSTFRSGWDQLPVIFSN
jgi:cytochrome P450